MTLYSVECWFDIISTYKISLLEKRFKGSRSNTQFCIFGQSETKNALARDSGLSRIKSGPKINIFIIPHFFILGKAR